MRLRRAQSDEGHHAVVNVTPLIDVVMCLIIFYLLVGKLAMEQRAKMILPSTESGISQIEPSVLTIEIPTDAALGEARLDGQTLSIAELQQSLTAKVKKNATQAVQLRADRSLPYSRVAPVLEACRQSGLSTVRLATMRSGT